MATATAAAAVGSCFTSTVSPRRCIVRSSCYSVPSFLSLRQTIDHRSIAAAPRRRTLPRTTAALAQEEASAEVEQQDKAEEGVEEEAREEEAEELPQEPKLYFGNLPFNCDSAELAGIIQEYASPEVIEVLYDRDTGKSKGYAFVTMSTIEDCKVVISNLDGSNYNGRVLRVNFSDKPKRMMPLYPESEYKLFVGNIAWSVTSEALKQVFQDYGNLVSARVIFNGETGKSRGYGFICYSNREEMEAAMKALNGVVLEGRPIRVCLAEGRRA
ncbi:hypothetical protein HPP92_025520 [Vanilla planifolia]|uniref:RRM domain-containing protein n=1 Tax=Vanilla planifolia TaxID=51239 RepID=A0A835PL62_VANPL|nr:hypothetical protein HPP92_025520 [Vanilla planifolia]